MSTGEFIDTLSLSHSLLARETVNCFQHVEDLKAIGNSRYRNRLHNKSSRASLTPNMFTQNHILQNIVDHLGSVRMFFPKHD